MSDDDFKLLIESIWLCRALSVIHMKCEAPGCDLTPEQATLLKEIYGLMDLDKIRLLCCRYLGKEKEAKELENWLEKRANRLK